MQIRSGLGRNPDRNFLLEFVCRANTPGPGHAICFDIASAERREIEPDGLIPLICDVLHEGVQAPATGVSLPSDSGVCQEIAWELVTRKVADIMVDRRIIVGIDSHVHPAVHDRATKFIG